MTCGEYRRMIFTHPATATRAEVAAVVRHHAACPGCRGWMRAEVEKGAGLLTDGERRRAEAEGGEIAARVFLADDPEARFGEVS